VTFLPSITQDNRQFPVLETSYTGNINSISHLSKWIQIKNSVSAVKKETVRYSETLVSTYEFTRRHNPEHHFYRRENLKYHNKEQIYVIGYNTAIIRKVVILLNQWKISKYNYLLLKLLSLQGVYPRTNSMKERNPATRKADRSDYHFPRLSWKKGLINDFL
jgi:hypothetical protein